VNRTAAYLIVLAAIAAGIYVGLAALFDTASAVLGLVVFVILLAARRLYLAAHKVDRIFREELDPDPFHGQHGNQHPATDTTGETR